MLRIPFLYYDESHILSNLKSENVMLQVSNFSYRDVWSDIIIL